MLSQWVGKEFHFDAAHFIPGHKLCGQVHGHTWKVNVEVRGQVQENGMVLDLHILSKVVSEVLSSLDHKLLNNAVELTPTCENLAQYILDKVFMGFGMEGISPTVSLKVKVQEGEGGYAIAQE